MELNIQDRFNKQLPADPVTDTTRRQVTGACFSYVRPRKPGNPQLLHYSPELVQELGLETGDAQSPNFLKVFSGAMVLPDTKPYAMCYGGHQFGSWAGQLGDGRAINLCEVEHQGTTWALQLKGAGETPYSRRADGLAVLRSSIREYLCSEAMHHLGVPTTRALSLVATGDEVLRDMMYDGHPAYEKGAVVCRVATSFIRFGNFEIFAARGDTQTLKQLVDYTIRHHFAHLGSPAKEMYIRFFQEVTNRSLEMVMHWQRVGFVHGVMNTDNMSILGQTIDYGPYGWLEGYDPGWTPNTTDRQFKRYRYGNQPEMVLWNLLQLANALYPLIGEAQPLEDILHGYRARQPLVYADMMRSKLGLLGKRDGDAELVAELESVLQRTETDMTIFFRTLADFNPVEPQKGVECIQEAFYAPHELEGTVVQAWEKWFQRYRERLLMETTTPADRKNQMNRANPKYVLRNYMAQLAIDEANQGNFGLVDELFKLLRNPYDEQTENEKWFAKRPEWARHKIGCSMLSCSS